MECEVIIVGLGPVGAMTANLLGQYGISTRVFERLSEIYFAPRAIAIDGEALRTFGMMGLAEWVDQHICKAGGEFRTAAPPEGQVLLDMSDVTNRLRYGCHQLGTFHQPTVEKKLREELEEHANVQVNLGHEVTDLVEANGRVHVTVRRVSSRDTEVYTCKFLLACDGGRSFVRKRLGLKYAGVSIPEHWLVMDVVCEDASMNKQWPNSTFVANSQRVFLNARLPGNLRRIEVLLKESEKALTMIREENTARLLSEIGIDAGKLTFERRMVYKFHARSVAKWRNGRIMLMGDAAHCMPPTKGQGLCCGLQDAANLAWKIAMLCRGNLTNELHLERQPEGTERESKPLDAGDDESSHAVDNLLDSYQAERRPWVTKQTEIVTGLRRIATLSSPHAVWLRDIVFKFMNHIVGLEYMLAESYKGEFDVHHGFFQADSPGAGHFFIQPSVTARLDDSGVSSVLLDAVLGRLWCWLSLDESPRSILSEDHYGYLCSIGCRFVRVLRRGADTSQTAWEKDEVVIVDDDQKIEKWMMTWSCHSVLLRPDRFVFGKVSRSPLSTRHCVDVLQSMLTGKTPLTVNSPPTSLSRKFLLCAIALLLAFILLWFIF